MITEHLLNGGIRCADIVRCPIIGEYWHSSRYYGYSEREAKRLFRQELKELRAKYSGSSTKRE